MVSEDHISVVDAFMFNGEPIVELRMALMNPYVDEFVIVESRWTHSGKRKDELFFETYQDMFRPYLHKIRLVEVNEFPAMPQGDSWIEACGAQGLIDKESWWRETYQREVIGEYLNEAYMKKGKKFIVFVCDADEIPNAEEFIGKVTKEVLYNELGDKPYSLQMTFMYYNFSWTVQENWSSAFMMTDNGWNGMLLSKMRRNGTAGIIANAGWHCSYFMPPLNLARKLQSFAHTEYSGEQYTKIDWITECIRTGKDVFGRQSCTMKATTTHDEKGAALLPTGWENFQVKLQSWQNL